MLKYNKGVKCIEAIRLENSPLTNSIVCEVEIQTDNRLALALMMVDNGIKHQSQ